MDNGVLLVLYLARHLSQLVQLVVEVDHFVDRDLAERIESVLLRVRHLRRAVAQHPFFPILLFDEVLSQLFAARTSELNVYVARSELANIVPLLHNVAREDALSAVALYRRLHSAFHHRTAYFGCRYGFLTKWMVCEERLEDLYHGNYTTCD